jgi:WD40 repeat protein
MSEAFAAWQVGNLTHAEELMSSCRSRAEQEGATLEIQLLQTLLNNSRPAQVFPSDGEVKSLAFSANGRYLAIGLLNGGVTVWNLETQQADILLAPGTDEIAYSVVFSPDDMFLAAGRKCEESRGEVLL